MNIMDKLVQLHQLEFQDGELMLMGWNATIISAQFFAELYSQLAEKGDTDILYQSAKRLAKQWMRFLMEKYSPPRDALISFAPKIFELEGFGQCKFYMDDPSKFRVVYSKSSLAKAYVERFGKSNVPVCTLVAGYLAGFASFAFGQDVDVKEVQCQAKGDGVCEFVSQGD